MEQFPQIKELEFTFFGKGSSLEGDFKLTGPTRIASKVKGEVIVNNIGEESSNLLSIEPEGSFEGKVHCDDLELYGHFKGEILSNGIVTIFPNAKFEGRIKAKNLIIHPGSFVEMEAHTRD
jgi:cytoskeletal protein CcmA (bactofilin family)